MNTINPKLLHLALQHADGGSFERFVNAFLADVVGTTFLPLGGTSDGGADAALESVYEGEGSKTFFQTSIQDNITEKVRQTVDRLREVGRSPVTLYHVCPFEVQRFDQLENKLSEKHGLTIKIRDGNFLAAHINSSPATIQAYNAYLSPLLAFLADYQNSWVSAPPEYNTSPAIYVFLRNELERRDSGSPSEALIDGLIVWALRDTDPEKETFMTENEILTRIEQDVPGMSSIAAPTLHTRIRTLSSSAKNMQRPIRRYHQEDKYCLAFDLRKKLGQDNAEGEAVKHAVFSTYLQRARAVLPEASEGLIEVCRDVAYKTIERTLENEGLEFAAFLTGKSDERQPVEKYIAQCLEEQGAAHADLSSITLGANAILDAAFLEPTDNERLLYSRLGAVYTILFCLRTEPKLIKYFEQMAGHFRLYIGADVIVKALSEKFIPEENKIFRKTLSLIREAGGAMYLAESVLEEVQHHIFSSSQEFKHRYMDNEDAISPELIPYVDRPLIRSYYYGKYSSAKDRPRNWWQYINGFCDPSDLTSNRTKEELKKYLQVEFGLIFESKNELEAICKGRDVSSLARLLEPHKKEKQLAYNDSLMVHVIYARRSQDGEANKPSIFGSKTWWLTNEHAVIQYTHDLVRQEGCRFLMRPDYLLNFLTFLPKTATARKTFNQLFPSMLGVHLARLHLPEDIQRLHQHLSEAKMLDASRRTVLIEGLINKLKGDHRQPSWYQSTKEE